MSQSNHDEEVPYERNYPLRDLILEEMAFMMCNKELYDLDFPQHFKPMSSGQLWDLARKKVLEQICRPIPPDDSNGDNP